jgi:RNA polymerase sigma factor (sigma-70 family)
MSKKTGYRAKLSPIGEVFLRYESAIKRVIGRTSNCGDEINDIAQETFLRSVVAEKRRTIDDPKAYLFATARNLARTDILKRSKTIIRIIEDSTSQEIPDNGPEIDEIMVSQERYALFCEAVATLPPQCRKVFLMCKIYMRSHKEIARTLDISVSTVEKHIGTGLARCAAYIRLRENTEEDRKQQQSMDKTKSSQVN